MTVTPVTQIESYALEATPMTAADIPRLHELSVAVAWPHRAEDWAMLIRLGRGIVARDRIGRAVGSAMWFPLGEDAASVGMVIVSPRLQDLGAGQWLMRTILAQTEGRRVVLNATAAAIRLYAALGFQPLGRVFQHQGFVSGAPLPQDGRVRPLAPGDAADAHALDIAAIGADRHEILAALLATSTGTVLIQAGRPTGFALSRRFGRGTVIGPVVAGSETDAAALIAPLLAAHRGAFVRLDTRLGDGPLRRMLEASGMAMHDTLTAMALGAPLHPAGPASTFALASHTLG